MTRSLADQRRKIEFALQVAEDFSLLGIGIDLDWNGRVSWPKNSAPQSIDPDAEYLLTYETTVEVLLGVLSEVKADLSNRNANTLAEQVAMQAMSLRAHRSARSDRREFSRLLRPAAKAARDLERALELDAEPRPFWTVAKFRKHQCGGLQQSGEGRAHWSHP